MVGQHRLCCPTLSWPAPVGHFNISQRAKYTHILNEREIEIIEFSSSNFTELIDRNPPDLRVKVGRILPSYLWITEVRSDDSRQVWFSNPPFLIAASYFFTVPSIPITTSLKGISFPEAVTA